MANTYSVDLELSSAQYAYVADNVALSITGDISIECWIKLEQLPSTATSSFAMVGKVDKAGEASNSYLFYIDTNDVISFVAWEGANVTKFTGDVALGAPDVAAWVHLAIAVDISVPSAVIYKNTAIVADTVVASAATTITDGDANFTIGRRSVVNVYYFDGLIDEVRLWNDIRSGGEISANYQTELGGAEAGLAGYWKLNNDYADSSPNSSTLTPVNTPVFSTDVPFIGAVAVGNPMMFSGGVAIG